MQETAKFTHFVHSLVSTSTVIHVFEARLQDETSIHHEYADRSCRGVYDVQEIEKNVHRASHFSMGYLSVVVAASVSEYQKGYNDIATDDLFSKNQVTCHLFCLIFVLYT